LRSYLLTVLALLGLAAAVNAQPAKQTGNIIVYNHASSFAHFGFEVDGGRTMKLMGNDYFRLTVTPGDHVITHAHIFLLGSDAPRVHVEAGQTVYFCFYSVPMMGIIFEVAEDQAEAAQSVKGLKARN